MPLVDTATDFHGVDGMGDLEYDEEPDLSVVREEPAATAIYQIAKNNPGQVDLICLAPLTNVAIAARLHEDFMSLIKGLYVMGGNYTGALFYEVTKWRPDLLEFCCSFFCGKLLPDWDFGCRCGQRNAMRGIQLLRRSGSRAHRPGRS